jgi:hypothetical protein
MPLFLGYVFFKGTVADQRKVVHISNVHISRSKIQPRPIPDEQIAAVQTMHEHRLPFSPYPYLREGMRVRVTHGILTGTEGILVTNKSLHRIVVSIDCIHRSFAFDIERGDVERILDESC